MAAKSFKGYGAMWSKPNEPEKEEDKQAHEKKNKQTPIKEKVEPEPIQAQEDNKKTPDNSIKQAHDKGNIETPNNSFIQNKQAHDNTFIPENKETPIKKRGRGRPKMETTEKKTHFNLLLRPATITALNTIAGRMQAETGKRVTVTGLITQLIDEFVAKQQEGA